MVLDIDIAVFAKSMTSYGQDKSKPPPKSKRPQIGVTPLSRQSRIDQIAKHLRHTAWKQHEQHTKQVQMLINQRPCIFCVMSAFAFISRCSETNLNFRILVDV